MRYIISLRYSVYIIYVKKDSEIKYSVKIIENINKIHYFVSGIEIFNFYFNVI